MKQRLFFAIFVLIFTIEKSIGQTNERIFYASFSPQDWDIYISKDAGKSLEKFTDHPSLDYDAVISPDGKWVVFTSERSGIPKLYAKAVEGKQPPVLLLKSNSFQDQAAFSPDGRQLAFVGSHQGNAEIYLLPFIPDSIQDIAKADNLTNHKGGDFRPAFSPDGKQIAFSSDRGHTIRPHPQFSFARQRIGDVYSVDTDGENLKRLTDSDSWDGSPVWSGDGAQIIFYSARQGMNSIFEMNADGSSQEPLFQYSGPAVSPKLLSDKILAFTSWTNERDFNIMQVDKSTNAVTQLFENGPDLMFNVDVRSNGLMVFHGGKYPDNPIGPGNFGFDGDVLAKIPDSLAVADKKVNFYGFRRAFVAPPHPKNTLLYYDSSDRQGLLDFLRPLGYSVFWLPILVVGLFLSGIVLGIRNRKRISFWRYFLFMMLTVLFGIMAGGIFFFVTVINPMSVITVHLVMSLLTIVLLVLGWWQYKRKTRRQAKGTETYRLSKLYGLLFFGIALFTLCCAVFINQFMNSTLQFYQTDYLTGEKKPLFFLEKEANTNPVNFRVLDSKVTHDGKALVFTTGSFGGRAHAQGDIWRYEFGTKRVTKLLDSPYNDGFADISQNGKMVFRSGRNGYFDIYLKSKDGLINLTDDMHRDNFPAISKTGDKVVFASDRSRSEDEYKTMDIFLMQLNSDGSRSEPEKISFGEGQNAHPHFSPDGEWVIYATEAYGINDEQPLIQPIIFSPQMYGEIIAYNIATKARIRLTHNKWEEGTPLWLE